jgi:flagellar motor component MotA
MILPRFTIRFFLGLMTAIGVLSVVISFATRGHFWAMAVCAALVCLMLIFALHFATFMVTFPVALIDATLRAQKQPTTPFATSQPPPQIMPPQEPE